MPLQFLLLQDGDYYANIYFAYKFAEVVELADALDSKSSVGNNVWVQVPPSAPNLKMALGFLTLKPFLFICVKLFKKSTPQIQRA